VLVFTPGVHDAPNNASTTRQQKVYASGHGVRGTIQANEKLRSSRNWQRTTIQRFDYTVVAADTLITIIQAITNLLSRAGSVYPGTPAPLEQRFADLARKARHRRE